MPLCGLCDADIKMRRTNCRGSEMMWGRLIGMPHFFSDQEWGGTEYRSLLVCEGRPRPFDCRTCLAILCRASWHYNTGVHITIQRESRMISCTQIRKVRPNIWLLSLRTFLQGVGTCPQVELALKLRQTTPTTCCIN